MPWDINQFLEKFRGGFDAGQQKRDEQSKMQAEQDKMSQKAEQEAQKAQEKAAKDAKYEELHQFKVQKEQLSVIEKLMKMLGLNEPTVAGASTETKASNEASPATPTATPTPDKAAIAAAIAEGLKAYGAKSGFENPLATASARMADQAVNNNLPDPYMPAAMNIMETGGSKHMAQPNNYFNWGTNAKPDINTAIDRMVQGVGNTGDTGLYKDYLQSGEMADFFKKYTPSTDPNNPALDTLLGTYTNIRNKYFPKI